MPQHEIYKNKYSQSNFFIFFSDEREMGGGWCGEMEKWTIPWKMYSVTK